MKVPNVMDSFFAGDLSLSRLQNEGSQPRAVQKLYQDKSIKATE